MTQQDKEQLKLEIDHIFESGANEIRIFEMVVNFIDSRNGVNKNFVLADVMALLPSDEDIKKAFPIMDDWSKEDKCYELGKIRGAEWVLSLVKVRLGNKL